ncbi:MAG: hemerythrin domain-containing protein [Actinomycetota bacterium]
MDALKLIKQDHDRFKKLMKEIHETTERAVKTRDEQFAKFESEIKAHERMEEEIFYPALLEHPKAKEIVLEGFEEHHAADVLLAELEDVPVDDEHWGAKFNVIKENIEHHMEEEEGDMFKKARSLLDDRELEELGARMEESKKASLKG